MGDIKTTSEVLFELILEKLNENTKSVEFSGNYVFKTWAQNASFAEFTLSSLNGDNLTFEDKKVVPLINTSDVEIPFTYENRMGDFEMEYYIPVSIPHETFNREIAFKFDPNNDEYQAILETLNNMRNLNENGALEKDGLKFVFKIKDPQKVSVFKHNAKYYQTFSLGFTITKFEHGIVGQEATFTLSSIGASGELDVVSADVTYGTDTRTFNTLSGNRNQFIRVNSQGWSVELVVNNRGFAIDVELEKHLHRLVSPDRVYEYGFERGEISYSRQVKVTGIGARYEDNVIVQFVFRVEETA